MKNKNSVYKFVLSVGLAFLLGYVSVVWSDESDDKVSLSVKPQKCIALHKGQTCYQRLTFTLTSALGGDQCLYQVPNVNPLYCWTNGRKGRYKIQFESNKSEVYQVRRPNETVVLSEVKVRLATVYKQSKKSYSGWRLF